MNLSCDVLLKGNDLIGEGPIWDNTNQRLLWNDILGKTAYQWDYLARKKKTLVEGCDISSIALSVDNTLIFAGEQGIYSWTPGHDPRHCLSEFENEPLAINDMVTDPKGRIYAGTKFWGEQGMIKKGKLYLIDPNGDIKIVDEGIELSNGLDFSPDAKTLYYADSAARVIYAYNVEDTGELSNREIFARISDDDGIPDGLTVDSKGFLWCAMWYGSQVIRFDLNGNISTKIPVPAKQTSSVGFGGSSLNELFVTSAGFSWESSLAPDEYDFSAPGMGGNLFVIKTQAKGKLPYVAGSFN